MIDHIEEYDAARPEEEQRPGVSTGALVGMVNGLLLEAIFAAVCVLIWECFKHFMR